MRYCLLVLAAGVFAVAGCDISGDVKDQVRAKLENARQQWQEQDIQDYRFRYSQQRGSVIVDTVEVFVRSGTIDSIATSPDVSEDEPLVGTVESFFDLIEDRVDEAGDDDSQFSASFDDRRGFPTSYSADFRDERRDHDIITIGLADSTERSP